MSSYDKVQYANEDRQLTGAWICPTQESDSQSFPTILMVPGIYGIREGEIEFAHQLSGLGFAVLIHDWLSAGQNPPDSTILADLNAAIRYLKGRDEVDASKIGLVGFCRGGTIALLAAGQITDFACVAEFYGQPIYAETNEDKPISAIDLVEQIQAPLCIVHGEADTVYPVGMALEYKKALEQKGKPFEFRTYENGAHAYFLPGHPNYNEALAKETAPFVISFLLRQLQP